MDPRPEVQKDLKNSNSTIQDRQAYSGRGRSPDGGLQHARRIQFALRGNVVDLAIGVVIGVAFGAIVASFVADIIMPIIGAIFGGLDFSNYYVPLSSKVEAGLAYADAKKQGAVLGYG